MTYTVLAIDSGAGVIGIASASASLAVGNSIAAIDPSTGAVASQAWTNRALRHEILAALRRRLSPRDALESALACDPGPQYRQVGVITWDAGSISHTGSLCTPWAGERSGPGYLAIGNYLAGAAVLDAAARVLAGRPATIEPAETPDHTVRVDESGRPLDFVTVAVETMARTLIAALGAAEDAGGDSRGVFSSCLLVARRSSDLMWPPDVDIDLRADDDPDPVGRLVRLLDRRLQQLTVGAIPSAIANQTVTLRKG